MSMFSNIELCTNNHMYTLTTIGLRRDYSKVFYTRETANQYMYKLLAKFGLKIKDIYNDKHDKTYCCNNGVQVFIQRA